MPEITENYIRLPVPGSGDFEEGSIRTITLSTKDGIKALIGKHKGSDKISLKTILFDVSKWDMEKAHKWMMEHGHGVSASVSYGTKFEMDILEATDKSKKVILRGKLLNDQTNENGWQVRRSDYDSLISSYIGKDVRIQHSLSDWEIVGKVVDMYAISSDIYYEAEITDTKAKDKFLSGTWTPKNIGVSPAVTFNKLECSICSNDIRKCGHKINSTYDNKIARATPIVPVGIEMSITSNPAYGKIGAGNIEEIDIGALVASIQSTCLGGNEMTEQSVTPTISVEEHAKIVAERDALKAEVSKLTSSMDVVTAEKKGFETKLSEAEKVSKEVESLKADKKKVEDMLLATSEKYEKLVTDMRVAELKTIVSDEKLIAEIMQKKLTDVEFTAEVSRTKKLKELFASQTGSASADGQKPVEKSLCEAEFGMKKEDILNSIIGGR